MNLMRHGMNSHSIVISESNDIVNLKLKQNEWDEWEGYGIVKLLTSSVNDKSTYVKAELKHISQSIPAIAVVEVEVV